MNVFTLVNLKPFVISSFSVTRMIIDQVCVVTSGSILQCLNQDIFFLGTGEIYIHNYKLEYFYIIC